MATARDALKGEEGSGLMNGSNNGKKKNSASTTPEQAEGSIVFYLIALTFAIYFFFSFLSRYFDNVFLFFAKLQQSI
jgi:hypothetical protein